MVDVLRTLWLWDWLRGRRGRGRRVAAIALYGFVALVLVGAIASGGKNKHSAKRASTMTVANGTSGSSRPAPPKQHKPSVPVTSTVTPPPPKPKAWTGMGAPLASFETAHPKNLAHCPAGTCFGGQLTNSEGSTDEFTLLMTTGGSPNRVYLYTQAFPDGTNVDEAKAQVLALMPRDTQTTAFFVQHDSAGATCAFWDIESATLGKWFSGPKVGYSKGVMGIELSTVDSSGNTIYEPSHATTANVALAPVDHSENC